MSQISPYRNEEYTVGWICPLPIELAAARAMLDEEHGHPRTPPRFPDSNAYSLGQIGKFKIVVAGLPLNQYGPSTATKVSENMLQTFPGIRFGLLVGIGGGIPHQATDRHQNVRMGDVVISSDKTGGVVWYDFEDSIDGKIHKRYALNQPPTALGTALTKMQAEHETRPGRARENVQKMLGRHHRMARSGFGYPGASRDPLFSFGYNDSPGRSCTECVERQVADRVEREEQNPIVHVGVIATGTKVVADAAFRDDIGRKHRAICIETEAAGLMNSFPCLVIRGISDYSDSLKHDGWQRYAAAVAAGCAKELLGYVEPSIADDDGLARTFQPTSTRRQMIETSERASERLLTGSTRSEGELNIGDAWIRGAAIQETVD